MLVAKRRTIDPSSLTEDNVQLLSIPAYDNNRAEIINPAEIGSSKKLVFANDLLVSKIVPHISRAWIVPSAPLPSLASTEWIVFSSEGFYPEYLRMIFVSGWFREKMLSTVSGMGSLKRANPSQVCKEFIPVPPLAEQRRIVARLNELLAVIKQAEDAYTDLQSLGKTLRERILQKAIEGKLVPQLDEEPAVEQIGEAPDEIPFAIPSKWQWGNFDDVISTIATKNHQIQTKEIKSSGKFPVISQSQQDIDGFSDDSKKLIPAEKLPCVLFGDHTRIVKKITKPCVIGADGTKLITSKFLDNNFLFYLISSIAPQLREAGYSRHFKFLRAHPLPVPPLAEQHRIVAKLNKLLPLVDQMTAV